MKKYLALFLTSTFIVFVYANQETRVTCEDKRAEFTFKQMEACLFLQDFSNEVQKIFSKNPEQARGLSYQAFTEWNKLLKNKEVQFTPAAIRHIEAVMWESGLKHTWDDSHSSYNIITSVIQDIRTSIQNALIPTIIATGIDYGFKKIVVSVDSNATLRTSVPGSSLIVNFVYSDKSSTTKACMLIPVALGIGFAFYKHVDWKQQEKLPFLLFDTENELEAYIESTSKAS